MAAVWVAVAWVSRMGVSRAAGDVEAAAVVVEEEGGGSKEVGQAKGWRRWEWCGVVWCGAVQPSQPRRSTASLLLLHAAGKQGDGGADQVRLRACC